MHQNVTVHDLAHEALHEFLHLDGKIFRTLKLLLVRPGELTLEYFRGRRARYISPVRLYLTCSLLFFAVVAVAPARNAKFEVTEQDVSAPGAREAIERVQERMNDARRELPHQAPRIMFVLMPLFALITWRFYHRRHPYYIPHLFYAIHFHAFVFLMFGIAKVLAFAGPAGDIAGTIPALTVFPYHYVAMHRVFGGTRTETAWKGTAVLVLYLLGLIVVFASILILWIRWAIAGADLHPS